MDFEERPDGVFPPPDIPVELFGAIRIRPCVERIRTRADIAVWTLKLADERTCVFFNPRLEAVVGGDGPCGDRAQHMLSPVFALPPSLVVVVRTKGIHRLGVDRIAHVARKTRREKPGFLVLPKAFGAASDGARGRKCRGKGDKAHLHRTNLATKQQERRSFFFSSR